MKIMVKKVGTKIAFEFIGKDQTIKFLSSPKAADALIEKIQSVRKEFILSTKQDADDIFKSFGIDPAMLKWPKL